MMMHTTFPARLAECSAKLGSKMKLAEAAGLSFSQLMRYMNGSSMPTMPRLMALAEAAGVTPAWLMSGDAASIQKTSQIVLEKEVFLQVLRIVEAVLQNSQRHVSPTRKSLFIFALCKVVEQAQNKEQVFLLSEPSLHEMLDFMNPYTDDELAELHTAIEHLPDEENPETIQRWVSLICRGSSAVYSSTSGQRYFERMVDVAPEYAFELKAILHKAEALKGNITHFLDLGCGNGRHLKFLHQYAPHLRLSGLDNAELAVHLCQTLEAKGVFPRGTVLKGDMRQMPYGDNSFDVVMARYSLFCVPLAPNRQGGLDDVFAEVARVLKPGGLFHATTRHGRGLHFYQVTQKLDAPTTTQLAHRHGLDVVGMRVFDANAELYKNPCDKMHEAIKDHLMFQLIKPLNWKPNART